jgi:hypothetical protein
MTLLLPTAAATRELGQRLGLAAQLGDGPQLVSEVRHSAPAGVGDVDHCLEGQVHLASRTAPGQQVRSHPERGERFGFGLTLVRPMDGIGHCGSAA